MLIGIICSYELVIYNFELVVVLRFFFTFPTPSKALLLKVLGRKRTKGLQSLALPGDMCVKQRPLKGKQQKHTAVIKVGSHY